MDDLRTRREKLQKELAETKEKAEILSSQGQQLAQRAVFLSGAIAVLNDMIQEIEKSPSEVDLAATNGGKVNENHAADPVSYDPTA